MGHSNIWNSHPKLYGPDSVLLYAKNVSCLVMYYCYASYAMFAVCVVTHMDSSGSMDSCAAGNASTATPRKLVSSSTVNQSMAGPFEDCRFHFGVLCLGTVGNGWTF
ncbi:hypothetical protein CTI12_AA327020 [Artemisia annua]|uniref:Uncharacterized protein n=1 Tax=Artemisia annua TaxID=35608 RepID=A0A2U1MZ18_ARTAN|nr:hypothetical protein CTI12_AA327020 [Artemisia annua]